MFKIIYWFIQLTWGMIQTWMGLLLHLYFHKNRHMTFHGSIVTFWHFYGGLSLGPFIFLPNERDKYTRLLLIHEYGHTLQSLLLGPFYLLLGIVSVIWANHPYFIKLRRRKHLPYTACFVEKWASVWGEKVTKEEALH